MINDFFRFLNFNDSIFHALTIEKYKLQL